MIDGSNKTEEVTLTDPNNKNVSLSSLEFSTRNHPGGTGALWPRESYPFEKGIRRQRHGRTGRPLLQFAVSEPPGGSAHPTGP
jgi:hypothetical protein